MSHKQTHFTELQRHLLNDFQRDLPLCSQPFAHMAEQLGVSESEVLETLSALQDEGVISRVGPVLAPQRVGASTLAAMAIPPHDLWRVAQRISAHAGVNHNYEREHRFNLWFVATAPNEARLAAVITELEQEVGYRALVLPMLEDYHIDLGFALQWT